MAPSLAKQTRLLVAEYYLNINVDFWSKVDLKCQNFNLRSTINEVPIKIAVLGSLAYLSHSLNLQL